MEYNLNNMTGGTLKRDYECSSHNSEPFEALMHLQNSQVEEGCISGNSEAIGKCEGISDK